MKSIDSADARSGFEVGTNLGGWLSQYETYDHRHFDSFIAEHNIDQIASWGMDHVRLPVDYPLFEDDEKPFCYKESGFDYVNRCLDWCERHGLNLILDLHRAPGFTFSSPETCSLFSQPELQERFLALWRELARRLAARSKPRIMFELLDEAQQRKIELSPSVLERLKAWIERLQLRNRLEPNDFRAAKATNSSAGRGPPRSS